MWPILPRSIPFTTTPASGRAVWLMAHSNIGNRRQCKRIGRLYNKTMQWEDLAGPVAEGQVLADAWVSFARSGESESERLPPSQPAT